MFQNRNNGSLRKAVVFLIFFISSACVLVSQGIPQVDNNKIFFLDGKTQIQIGKNDRYHIFSKHNRVVYITFYQRQNYGEYTINFFDFNGRKIVQADIVTGSMFFVFSETNERVLAGQRATLTRQNDSYLYDLDGNLLKVLNSTYDTKQIGMTEDENYFWFAENKWRQLQPGEKIIDSLMPNIFLYNHIMIFDVRTGEFVEEYSTQESPFSFMVNGKKYVIPVSPPDLPG